MFVRRKKLEGREFFQVVENSRIDGKVRQKILLTLGPHPTVEAAAEAHRKGVAEAKVWLDANQDHAVLGEKALEYNAWVRRLADHENMLRALQKIADRGVKRAADKIAQVTLASKATRRRPPEQTPEQVEYRRGRPYTDRAAWIAARSEQVYALKGEDGGWVHEADPMTTRDNSNATGWPCRKVLAAKFLRAYDRKAGTDFYQCVLHGVLTVADAYALARRHRRIALGRPVGPAPDWLVTPPRIPAAKYAYARYGAEDISKHVVLKEDYQFAWVAASGIHMGLENTIAEDWHYARYVAPLVANKRKDWKEWPEGGVVKINKATIRQRYSGVDWTIIGDANLYRPPVSPKTDFRPQFLDALGGRGAQDRIPADATTRDAVGYDIATERRREDDPSRLLDVAEVCRLTGWDRAKVRQARIARAGDAMMEHMGPEYYSRFVRRSIWSIRRAYLEVLMERAASRAGKDPDGFMSRLYDDVDPPPCPPQEYVYSGVTAHAVLARAGRRVFVEARGLPDASKWIGTVQENWHYVNFIEKHVGKTVAQIASLAAESPDHVIELDARQLAKPGGQKVGHRTFTLKPGERHPVLIAIDRLRPPTVLA